MSPRLFPVRLTFYFPCDHSVTYSQPDVSSYDTYANPSVEPVPSYNLDKASASSSTDGGPLAFISNSLQDSPLFNAFQVSQIPGLTASNLN